MRFLFALVALLALSACTLSSTSRRWNGRVGPRGVPVYIKSQTNIGFNAFIAVPIPGIAGTSTESMLDLITSEIAAENGDQVRVFQSGSTNYWFGFPPFTWFLTPVITTVDAEYEPAAEILAKDRAEEEDR